MYMQCKKCRLSDNHCECEYRQTYLPLDVKKSNKLMEDGRALHYEMAIKALSAKKRSPLVLPLPFEHQTSRPSQTLQYGT